MNVLVGFYFEERVHPNCSQLGNLPDVVSHQINNHEVLCTLFVACQEFLGERDILHEVISTLTSALNGFCCEVTIWIHREEYLWATGEQSKLIHDNQSPVVTGVSIAQAQIDLERIEMAGNLNFVSEAQLIGITFSDGIQTPLN